MQHKNARENGKAATCRKMQDIRDNSEPRHEKTLPKG